jgi:hypothetical protein
MESLRMMPLPLPQIGLTLLKQVREVVVEPRSRHFIARTHCCDTTVTIAASSLVSRASRGITLCQSCAHRQATADNLEFAYVPLPKPSPEERLKNRFTIATILRRIYEDPLMLNWPPPKIKPDPDWWPR